jgi:hypothetical protein
VNCTPTPGPHLCACQDTPSTRASEDSVAATICSGVSQLVEPLQGRGRGTAHRRRGGETAPHRAPALPRSPEAPFQAGPGFARHLTVVFRSRPTSNGVASTDNTRISRAEGRHRAEVTASGHETSEAQEAHQRRAGPANPGSRNHIAAKPRNIARLHTVDALCRTAVSSRRNDAADRRYA